MAATYRPATRPLQPYRRTGPVVRLLGLLIVLAALVFAIQPLLGPFQISGHSTYSDLVRVAAFHASVDGGDWTPRWLPDFYLRHGSPTFHFYSPGGYYLIELLQRLGASPLWALKLAFLFAWLLGTTGIYLLAGRLVGRGGAGVAAIAYALSPYLLIDVYMRNGIAEVLAFGLLPWALWATLRTAREGGAVALVVAALAGAALALSHNITSLVATPLLLGLALWAPEDSRGRRRALASVALGLALSAFFWLPALLDKGQVAAEASLTGGYFDYQRHFLAPLGMLSPAGGGPLVIGPRDVAAIKLGAPLVIGLAVALLVLLVPNFRRRQRDAGLVAYFLAAALLCLAMATALTGWFWAHLPLLPFVQFPWRFLLPATCLAAPLVGLVPGLIPHPLRRGVRLALVLLAVTVAAPYILRVYVIFEPAAGAGGDQIHLPALDVAAPPPGAVAPHKVLTIETIRARGVTGTASHEFLPRAVTRLPALQPPAAEVLSGQATISAGGWGYPRVWAQIDAASEAEIALGQFWFPGWRVRLDGAKIPVRPEPGGGRLLVTVPPGRHRVEARFGASSPVWAGYALTLLGWLALAWLARRESRAARPALTFGARP